MIYSDTLNISVRFRFGFGSLHTKILNMFEYLTNYDSDLVLPFESESLQFFEFRFLI